MLDRESVYDVLDRLRASLPETIKAVRWERQQRADDDAPISLDVLKDIDALDDLMHTSRPVPLSDSVRVKRDRLTPILDRLRAVLIPLGQELADFKSSDPTG